MDFSFEAADDKKQKNQRDVSYHSFQIPIPIPIFAREHIAGPNQ